MAKPIHWFSGGSILPDGVIMKLYKENQQFKECYDKILKCYELWSFGDENCDIEEFGYGKEVWKIYNDIDYLEKEYSNATKYGFICYMKIYYDLADKICDVYSPEYTTELILKTEEIVNGYELYDTTGRPIMYRSLYENLVTMWKTNKEYTYEEFMDFYDNACSDWAKQDAHGESFCGYWKCMEGTTEREENAWRLTRNANGIALWKLPYPKEVICETIKIGCNNRTESVRISNFICEWVKRKMEQMNK